MSEEITNQWRKRPTILLECPSGNKCYAQRVGPHISLKAGKLAKLFSSASQPEDVIEEMSDAEAAQVYAFAKQIVIETVVQPRLVARAVKESDVTPDDLPTADFWFLFKWAMRAAPGLPVKLADGEETTVEAVETFSEGQATGVIAGVDSEQVS